MLAIFRKQLHSGQGNSLCFFFRTHFAEMEEETVSVDCLLGGIGWYVGESGQSVGHDRVQDVEDSNCIWVASQEMVCNLIFLYQSLNLN